MKKFISKYIIFVLPIIALLSGDIFLSIDTFTHRPWEALLFKSNKTMYFYPNQSLNNLSVGDLCHNTTSAIKKNEHWLTDELGYRNNSFIKKPEILIIGDSFIVGSSITQDSTITNLLIKNLNKKVYNIAPANFVDFIDLLNRGVIEKPKTVIYSLNEKGIPSPIKILDQIKNKEKVTSFSVFKDKVERLYSLKYLNSRIRGKHGKGKPGKVDSSMFFLNGALQEYHYDNINETVSTIKSYEKYCDSIGVDFIFLPLPNKETVYFDKIPLKTQPDYLYKLNSVLTENKIKTVNTLELFNNYRKANSSIIYHLDDSHWNSKGVEIVSTNTAEYIRKNAIQE